jgi:predicted RNA binding protein YcfA (HicA-like mRNA interferase family)
MSFSELVRLLQANGFRLVREKGSVRYYGKDEWPNLVRVDFHGSKQMPRGTLHAIRGTLHAILKAAGISRP